MKFELMAWLEDIAKTTENGFSQWTPSENTKPEIVHKAMRYSLLAGGKRLRPALLVAAFSLFENPAKTQTPTLHSSLFTLHSNSAFPRNPVPAMVALECLHTYSLIHDDLPCMDNSDLRRGKPTCHKIFGETMALLAGDALLTHALTLPSIAYADVPATAAKLTQILGTAADSQRMIGGQVEDILGENGEMTRERLDFIHENKTAALITAALLMGATLAEIPAGTREKVEALLRELGHCIGVAYQIIDDILDETSDAGTLGKPVHADVENRKTTYPALHGMEQAKRDAGTLTSRALAICDELDSLGGNAEILRELSRWLLSRER